MVLVCGICVSADETDKLVWESTNGTDRTNHHLAKTLISLLQKYVYRFLSTPPWEDQLQLLPRTQFLSRFFSNILCAIVNSSNFQYKLINPLSHFKVPSPYGYEIIEKWELPSTPSISSNFKTWKLSFHSLHWYDLNNYLTPQIPHFLFKGTTLIWNPQIWEIWNGLGGVPLILNEIKFSIFPFDVNSYLLF